MPVEGFPDPARHKLCRRCRKWFEPNEGALMAPEATGPLGAVQGLRASLSGSEADLRFQCDRCTKVRRITKIALFLLFVAIVGIVLLLERLGLLKN